MSAISNINTTLVDGYLRLLDNLTLHSKLEIISRLTLSIKEDGSEKRNRFKKSYGAFESKKTAEELITEIRSERTFTREIELF